MKKQPERIPYPTRAFWVLFIASILSTTVPENLAAQSNLESDPQTWKTNVLNSLSASLKDHELTSEEKTELLARQAWLLRWTPGTLTSRPNSPFDSPEVTRTEFIVEPILSSSVSALLKSEIETNHHLSEPDLHSKLKQLVSELPEDTAVLQIYLHWMDNDNHRRKNFLPEIDATTRRLAQLLGDSTYSDAAIAKESAPETRQRILEFTLYRRVRALAYRELPEVVERLPINDQSTLNMEIKDAFAQLQQVAGGGRAEFILIEIRMHRRNKNYGTALELLERFGDKVSQKWYLKKRRDLLELLEWTHPQSEAASIYAQQFPDEVAKEKEPR